MTGIESSSHYICSPYNKASSTRLTGSPTNPYPLWRSIKLLCSGQPLDPMILGGICLMVGNPGLQRAKVSAFVLPAGLRNVSPCSELCLESSMINSHAEVWEGHAMTFDPNVCQDTSIRIAHQLQLVRISHVRNSAAGKGLPSVAGCRCNDLSLYQQHYQLSFCGCLPRW